MPSFALRVELHDADADDYEQLHASMQERGFDRTIVADDNSELLLPTGTYVGVALSIEAALAGAQAATAETGRNSWIVVFHYDAWYGTLPPS
jgi:hypothetical protein